MQALNNFRRNLRTALDSRGLSYRTFAEKSGVTYIYVYRICNPNDEGKPEPSLDVCDRLATALGYDLAQMLMPPKAFRALDSNTVVA